jgi:hypothetical protein
VALEAVLVAALLGAHLAVPAEALEALLLLAVGDLRVFFCGGAKREEEEVEEVEKGEEERRRRTRRMDGRSILSSTSLRLSFSLFFHRVPPWDPRGLPCPWLLLLQRGAERARRNWRGERVRIVAAQFDEETSEREPTLFFLVSKKKSKTKNQKRDPAHRRFENRSISTSLTKGYKEKEGERAL